MLMPCGLCAQLETVYVLEGLGPPKEQSYGQKSFSDQVSQPLISSVSSFLASFALTCSDIST